MGTVDVSLVIYAMDPMDGHWVIYVATRGSYGSCGWPLVNQFGHQGELWVPRGNMGG